MRWGKLVWAAIGYAAAVFLAEYVLPVRGLPYLAAALVFLSPGALLLQKSRRRPALILVLAAAAGLLAWWGRYELHVAPCEALAGQDVTVTARVTDYPVTRPEYSRVPVTVMDGAPRERAYFYLYHDELPDLRPGDILTATVHRASAMTRQGERAHNQTSAGRNMIGYFRETPEVTGRWEHRWIYFPRAIARYVGETCLTLFPDDTGILMKALLTGDKEELYDNVPLYGSMRQAGMLHAVAVSGMHVFVLIFFLQTLLGRGRRASLLSLPVMALFVLMAGCGPSVVRAAVMQTIYMAAPLFHRESDGPSGLAAAALFLLLLNPMAIGGVGLQLSFACMLGFAVFLPRLERRIRNRRYFRRSRAAHGLWTSLACTASATVFSLPVSAWYFGTVPLLSPLANLLTLPVLEICFGAGYGICALNAVFPAGAAVLARILSWGVRWCLLVFRQIARVPFACLYTADPGGVILLIGIYILLFALLKWGGGHFPYRAGVFLLSCVLGVAAVSGVSALRLLSGRRELAVLDVGQGQCVAMLDATAAVVVDCGGSGWTNAGDRLADYLLSAGKRHVDVLILTHLHEDHINGVETLLFRMPVLEMILPADAAEDGDSLTGILAAAEENGTRIVTLAGDGAGAAGDIGLALYQPQAGTEENERGIVALADLDGRTALIMGDAGQSCELAMVERGLVPDVDVLVAGHHGSKTASSPIFLLAARPETAAISAGRGNSFGLPAEDVVERLTDYGAAVRRTDVEGTLRIDMRTDG